jgi:hypothetical protein
MKLAGGFDSTMGVHPARENASTTQTESTSARMFFAWRGLRANHSQTLT